MSKPKVFFVARDKPGDDRYVFAWRGEPEKLRSGAWTSARDGDYLVNFCRKEFEEMSGTRLERGQMKRFVVLDLDKYDVEGL